MVFGVGPSSRNLPSHLVTMKLIAILVILCRSAHRNNSNYIPLLIGLYFYSAGARTDAITLLNHFGLSVSYDVLQRKLRDITSMSKNWIKQQATNYRLVGAWDNFEFRENVHGERVDDTVKFRSITMALWIRHGWRIPKDGLKQWMWNPKKDLLSSRIIIERLFGSDPDARNKRNQCIRHHRFTSFISAFPDWSFSYSAAMPRVKNIDCKIEGASEAYSFAPSMASESTTAGNISVFEDLAIHQLGFKKEDLRFNEALTVWWGDQKTEVLMLSMQGLGVGMDRPYDWYQHIFPGLALWHLQFNYLKMIWEVFYPGGSSTERSTLQWAADHWHRIKTTQPKNFHSLEDLTIHSYRARIVAIMKPWIQKQNPKLRIHSSEALGEWLSLLTASRWNEGMDWLNAQMEVERTEETNWNDHWNNHLRFCKVVEAYLTLSYSIKHGDIGLLQAALREVGVILQAPAAKKPKYAKEMLCQLHILDTTAADPLLQEAYLANALVNLRGLPHTFYEMDLLLEHQNGKFKRFRQDRGSSLQDSEEMFRVHALSVDALAKIRRVLNQVVVGQDRSGRHLTKDASFDILSLADHLHRSKSTLPGGPVDGKIYFSENPMPDLLEDGVEYLTRAVEAYNESVKKSEAPAAVVNGKEVPGEAGSSIQFPIELIQEADNETVNDLFLAAREGSQMTSDLADLFI